MWELKIAAYGVSRRSFVWTKSSGSDAEAQTHQVEFGTDLVLGAPLHNELHGPAVPNPSPLPALLPIRPSAGQSIEGVATATADAKSVNRNTHASVAWRVDVVDEETLNIAGQDTRCWRLRRTVVETLTHPVQGRAVFQQETEEWYSTELGMLVRVRGTEREVEHPVLNYEATFDLELTVIDL